MIVQLNNFEVKIIRSVLGPIETSLVSLSERCRKLHIFGLEHTLFSAASDVRKARELLENAEEK